MKQDEPGKLSGTKLDNEIPSTGDSYLEDERRLRAQRFADPRARPQLDDQLERMRRVWSGDPAVPEAAVGPPPVQPNGPELLVAGHVPGSFARVARFADGWIYGWSSPEERNRYESPSGFAYASPGGQLHCPVPAC